MPAFDLDQIRHGKIIEWTVAYITAGEATMRLIHLTTTVALVLSVSPATAQVQWRVTPEDVRLACQAMRQDTSQVLQQSITGSLKRFCNLSLGGWDAWADTTIRFSIGDSIVAWANVARRQAQEAVQSLTTGLGQPTTVIVSPSITQSGQPGAPATRGPARVPTPVETAVRSIPPIEPRPTLHYGMSPRFTTPNAS